MVRRGIANFVGLTFFILRGEDEFLAVVGPTNPDGSRSRRRGLAVLGSRQIVLPGTDERVIGGDDSRRDQQNGHETYGRCSHGPLVLGPVLRHNCTVVPDRSFVNR